MLHHQLTNTPAHWLPAFRDFAEKVALWVCPEQPLPPADSAPVVVLVQIHLQEVTGTDRCACGGNGAR